MSGPRQWGLGPKIFYLIFATTSPAILPSVEPFNVEEANTYFQGRVDDLLSMTVEQIRHIPTIQVVATHALSCGPFLQNKKM